MQTDTAAATRLMIDFAARTGVSSDAEPRRYLWTDAFALMNALDLYRETGAARWRDLAVALVDQVHNVLGRHHPDDARTGWLSGLPEGEGACHPTIGGLRIGKPLPERGSAEPEDERLEWDRDGQYWHYLTKWMDALSRAAILLDESRYQAYAEELARAAFSSFLQTGPAGRPMGLAWKMSVDLSRPQVAGISPHDALDGYVTFRWLGRTGTTSKLADETAILRLLAGDRSWATADPLGLGGLLLDAFRLALLPDRHEEDARLIAAVISDVDAGLLRFFHQDTLALPADRRLGFRELGLAIGFQTLPPTATAAKAQPDLARSIAPSLDRLRARADIGQRIISFWSDPKKRQAPNWQDHRDINEVMLATALLDAFIGTAISGQERPASEEPKQA